MKNHVWIMHANYVLVGVLMLILIQKWTWEIYNEPLSIYSTSSILKTIFITSFTCGITYFFFSYTARCSLLRRQTFIIGLVFLSHSIYFAFFSHTFWLAVILSALWNWALVVCVKLRNKDATSCPERKWSDDK